jgi:hypothetical protein
MTVNEGGGGCGYLYAAGNLMKMSRERFATQE